MIDRETSLPTMALYLGYGGLLPFLGLAIASLNGYEIQAGVGISTGLWLAIYAAVIISFLGAIHWGVVIAQVENLKNDQSNILLIYSVIPSLLAWFCFLFTMKFTLFLLGSVVLFCYLMDRLILFKHLNKNMSIEFSKLRIHLTIVVSLCLYISAFNL